MYHKRLFGVINVYILIFVFNLAGFTACTTTPNKPANTGIDPLDAAIRETSDYLNNKLKKGIKIVFLNFQSESPALSEYIIDGLIENTVNDSLFTVVDRQNLALIQKEINFQFSGEVSDESAQEIGKLLGAQVIVSGAISPLGNLYRLRVRAISVETAEIQGQINRDINSSPRIIALLANRGAALAQSSYPTGNSASSTATSTADMNKNVITTTAVPDDTGAIIVNSLSAWSSAINKIRAGGNNQTYIINVSGAVSVPGITENLFSYVTGLTVTIQGGGTLSLSNKGCLLKIGAGQTVILRNITLRGLSVNNNAVVNILKDSIFRMEDGSTITGNTNNNGRNFNGCGGGVIVGSGGTFTMQGGTISGNTAGKTGGGDPTSGGGVLVSRDATFIMQGGTISGNKADWVGGGVYIESGGTFTKTGGTIFGKDASLGDRNTGRGSVAFLNGSSSRYRNATAGPDDNTTGGYGFWLND